MTSSYVWSNWLPVPESVLLRLPAKTASTITPSLNGYGSGRMKARQGFDRKVGPFMSCHIPFHFYCIAPRNITASTIRLHTLPRYDTKVDVCGHGFRPMACNSLIESGLWSRDAVERQMSHQEPNGVRAAYTHKAESLDERRLMLQWWADFLGANKERIVSPFDFAK